MNPSLASLALVVITGVCLVAYLFGFNAGRDEGHDKGHSEGREQGKKEGSVRAFAVGFDRGKRQALAEKEEGDKGDESNNRLSLPAFILIIILTVAVLTLLRAVQKSW